jgi:hypothetical protein
MQANIDNLQGANNQNYLKTVAEQLVSSTGSPVDWGSNGLVPERFGLAKEGGKAYELDANKLARLTSQCSTALTYYDVSQSARLYDIAFNLKLTQMLSINLQSTSNTTDGSTTTYNFQVTVMTGQEPTATSIQCYIIKENQIDTISASTSSLGQGSLSFQLPNSSPGPVQLVAFAKANIDQRLTAYQTISFIHIAGELQPTQNLSLSPLNNQLTINITQPDTTVNKVYALTYSHQSQLVTINGNYQIPNYVDKSPIVLIALGQNPVGYFTELASYPVVPLSFGSDFANTAQNPFVFTVTVNDVLYKLTVTLGELGR